VRRFHFPLDRVRRWRSEQASIEELKLQQLRAEAARLLAAKLALEREAASSAQQVLAQPFFDPMELTTLDAYRTHLRRRAAELDAHRHQMEARIAEQREHVIEARRQFELLDRLHGKAWREWLAASNKEQEELASELFLAQSGRERSQRAPRIAR